MIATRPGSVRRGAVHRVGTPSRRTKGPSIGGQGSAGPTPRPRPEDAGPAERLAAERARTEQRVAALRRDFDRIVEAAAIGSTDDEHDPEGATIAFERAQVQALLDQADRHLAALDAAEERLRDGGYGRCTACGAAIDPARLEARPTAERCVACS